MTVIVFQIVHPVFSSSLCNMLTFDPQVMCWGVRNMKKFQLGCVSSPNVELEVGGHLMQSKVIKNTLKNPNFDEPLLFFDIVSI